MAAKQCETWPEGLERFIENSKPKKDLKIKDKEDYQMFEEEYCKLKGIDPPLANMPVKIPKFYAKPPSEGDVLQLKLREEARANFLQRRSAELIDNDDLQKLWSLLEEKHTQPQVGDDQMIGFEDFMNIKDLVSEPCRQFFTAQVFSKLLKDDPLGRLPVTQLFSYIMRKVWLQQTRIGLSLFDIQGLGYLKESDLENYILELIGTLSQLNRLEESFYSFYVCTAVRKFFFFLDPLRTGRVKIQDILGSGFLDDLLELRDEDLTDEALQANWFSAQSALRVYGQYLSLDTDHNGMLSKSELSRFRTGTLTKVFVDRIFQECLTYEDEMDYKTYLDFVLAMEYKKEPQSIQYFFRLLDIESCNYLSPFTLKYFFKAIQEQIQSHGQEAVKFEDIKDEIFDMVKPLNPSFITLQDLFNSGQGETIVNILTDLNGFLNYENREFLLAEEQEGTFV